MFERIINKLLGRVVVNGVPTKRFWLKEKRFRSFTHFAVFGFPVEYYQLDAYSGDHLQSINNHLTTFVLAENFLRKRLANIFPEAHQGEEYEIISYERPYFIVVASHSGDWTMAYRLMYGFDQSFNIEDAYLDKR